MAGVTELYRRSFHLFGIALKRYRFLHEVVMEKVSGRGGRQGAALEMHITWEMSRSVVEGSRSSTAESNQIQPGVYTTLAYFTTKDLTLSMIAD